MRTRFTAIVLVAVAVAWAVPAQAQEIRGTWESLYREGRRGHEVQLSLRTDRDGRATSQHGSSVLIEELSGVSGDQLSGSADNLTFHLEREAGTVTFEGDIRDGRGTGVFRFVANDAYLRAMGSLGYSDLRPDLVYQFAVLDLTTDTVLDLQSLGYRDLSEDRLFEFAVHGVSPEFVREMNSLGYADIEPEMLVQLRIHGVSPEYVRRVRAALGG